jgi:hypothetical protein
MSDQTDMQWADIVDGLDGEVERLTIINDRLLDALETLLDASERHIFGDECLAERDAARAAIAKAKGDA